MKKLLILLGVAGAGYLLYKHFSTTQTAASTSTTQTTLPGGQTTPAALPSGLPSDAVLIWGPLTYSGNGQILSLFDSPSTGFYKLNNKNNTVVPISAAQAQALSNALGGYLPAALIP